MSDRNDKNTDKAFDLASEELRIAAGARMLDEDSRLQPNQREDIKERFQAFIAEHGIAQNQAAREIGISSTTISEVVRGKYTGKTGDTQLARVHNWLELAARREALVGSREFVHTSVAREIMVVARTVAESCRMGVVFGPAQIGKSFTLRALVGNQAFGAPVLIRVDEATLRPKALCRAVCSRFELPTSGTFDVLLRRLVKRLAGTRRLLMFDEAERLCYKALETIRDLHDQTGCPVLFCGKPAIYERLGFRTLGDYAEVTDQLAARIVMKRDLTERTRGDSPEPLFSLEDVRKLVTQSGLKLHIEPDAEQWLQGRASTLGLGGIGKAIVSLYLAEKIAIARGDAAITVRHLEDVDGLAMGHEDAERVADVVRQSSGMRRVV